MPKIVYLLSRVINTDKYEFQLGKQKQFFLLYAEKMCPLKTGVNFIFNFGILNAKKVFKIPKNYRTKILHLLIKKNWRFKCQTMAFKCQNSFIKWTHDFPQPQVLSLLNMIR